MTCAQAVGLTIESMSSPKQTFTLALAMGDPSVNFRFTIARLHSELACGPLKWTGGQNTPNRRFRVCFGSTRPCPLHLAQCLLGLMPLPSRSCVLRETIEAFSSGSRSEQPRLHHDIRISKAMRRKQSGKDMASPRDP